MEKRFNKNLKTENPKTLVRIVFVLLLLVMVFCASMTISKYVTMGSGSDNASVAKFDVVVTPGANSSLSINLNNSQTAATYSFSVKNNSEVKIQYDVVVTFQEALPSGITLTLDGSAYTSSSSSKVFTFANKTLSYGGASKSHSLLFTINESTYNDYVVSSGNTEKVLSSINIKVNARQAS